MPTLNWLTREQDLKAAANAEYRLLVEDEQYSCGDPDTGNIIVQGDNLEALKALLPFYAGQVKCIYIDPPYNTGSAFEHYDDNMEHTIWLSIMYPRLKLLKQFLRQDGSIWIQIDDEEQAYLKIICDEIFGRSNFVNMISVNMKNIAGASGGGEDTRLKKNCEYILIYARSYSELEKFKSAYTYREIGELVEQYKKDGVSWKYTSVLYNEGTKEYIGQTTDGNGDDIKIYKRNGVVVKSILQVAKEEKISEYEVYNKYAKKIFQTAMPQSSIRPRVMKAVEDLGITNEFYSIEYTPKTGRNKGNLYEQFYRGENFRLFAWLGDVSEEIDGKLYKRDLSGTYWDFVGETKNLSKEGDVVFPNGKKPEKLIQRIFEMTTTPGDYVLDSFLGSGTTAAVAHKMGRRYIGVEMGEQAKTHCVVRLKKVIDGEQGGISEAVGWKGGGGFRFFSLGDAIFDNERRIKPDISFENLAAHIYFTETKTPINQHTITQRKRKSPFLGIHNDTAYALLYNGVLGDKSVSGGNVLTHHTLNYIKSEIEAVEKKKGGEFEYNQIVVYGEATRLTHVSLVFNNIIFKQTPYDIKVW
jgi:adenine-specific DNA-methyltransferase